MNVLQHTTALAQAIAMQYVNEEGSAVDATCGNGNDTLWLAEHFARVYSFDIQKRAIDTAAELLRSSGRENVMLICDSHEKIKEYVHEMPDVILFNLGYLPGGDKTAATAPETTMPAVRNALDILAVNGLLCVTMYQGHVQGRRERSELLKWAAGLDSSAYHCVHTDMCNQPSDPPEILWITKKKANHLQEG